MRFDPTQIILRPRISEKTVRLREEGTYTFDVHQDANKIEIKDAVERLFKVKVKRVNTITSDGKSRRVGRSVGVRASVKKAMITLQAGHKIEGI